MTTKKPLTLSEHMSNAAKARHAKLTPEQRSAYAKKMVEAREAKREEKRVALLAMAERVREFNASDIRILPS